MSVAAETRREADEHPFLIHALRAGICNYTAAARFLEIDGDVDATATALRRYADELPPFELSERAARVTMQSGLGPVSDPDDALVVVGEAAFGHDGGDLTAILATGTFDADALATILARLALEDVAVSAAAFGGDQLVVVVARRHGANALRTVERALETVPEFG